MLPPCGLECQHQPVSLNQFPPSLCLTVAPWLQVCSCQPAWCCSPGWARQRWLPRPSPWFCPHCCSERESTSACAVSTSAACPGTLATPF